MSEAELEALRSVFALFDTDGTGEIDSTEFAAILSKVGRDPTEGVWAALWANIPMCVRLLLLDSICRAVQLLCCFAMWTRTCLVKYHLRNSLSC